MARWTDGVSRTGQMTLATTVALPVVRGPVALAKNLAAIDLLSGGRLVEYGQPAARLAPDIALGKGCRCCVHVELPSF